MAAPAPRPHFHLFGIPVRVEPMFFLLPLMALANRSPAEAASWAVLVFVGVLLHELGHALAMKWYSFSPSITLHALGGVTQYPATARPPPRQVFFITLAGPTAGLMLGVLALALRHFITDPSPLVSMALEDAIRINIGWSIINLLPILPWDGGLILDSGLEWATGKRRDLVVGASSLLGGALIVLLAVQSRQLMLGYFGVMGLMNGWQRVARANGTQQSQQQQRTFWEKVQQGDEVDADLEFQIMTAADPAKRAQFAELLAWSKLRKRDFAGARAAVKQMGRIAPSHSLQARLAAASADPERVIELLWGLPTISDADLPLLISALLMRDRRDDVVKLATQYASVADVAATRLFQDGAWEHALTVLTAERQRTGLGRFAYNEACCLCRLGRLDDAVTMLQKAHALGCPELKGLDADEDLAPIRERPEVRALLT
ncbi:MAG: hypothetical protein U0228_00550 [Myxococcaceae bacterium]